MDITPIISDEKKIIKGYGKGYFKINNDKKLQNNIIIFSSDVVTWNVDNDFKNIKTESFAELIKMNKKIDLILIGCGEKQQILPFDIKAYLNKKGFNVEVMTTGAACRTYNILLSEGRNVASCLLKL